VILIDLDGTIIPDQEAFRDAAAAVLDTHLRSPRVGDREPVEELLARARDHWKRSPLRGRPDALGVSSWEALWTDLDHRDPATPPTATGHAVAVWQDTLTALGADARQARTAAQSLISEREALAVPYPGAREVIQKFAISKQLWLVTHGSSALQRRKLHLADLERYFDLVLISAEVGRLKDTPEFAARIQQELRRSGRTIRAVIGDSIADLTLAARGGWPAIHICRRWPCAAGGPSVDHRKTLADCPALDDSVEPRRMEPEPQ
jgi:FMN phosphatase YigB (HAD superfamily)